MHAFNTQTSFSMIHIDFIELFKYFLCEVSVWHISAYNHDIDLFLFLLSCILSSFTSHIFKPFNSLLRSKITEKCLAMFYACSALQYLLSL